MEIKFDINKDRVYVCIMSFLKVNEDYEKEFERIVNELINSYLIKCKDKLYNICEVEVYYKDKGHPDPFVHCSLEQKTCGEWYFHKMGGSYKEGTFRGLDLTFGGKNAFGGILIRSLSYKDKDDNIFIEGPCNVVNTFLKALSFNTVKEFVSSLNTLSAFDCDSLKLVKRDNNNNRTLYSGPRVGLTLKKFTESRLNYICKNYRYLTDPKKIKKYKNTIVYKMILDSYNDKKIIETSGTTKKTLDAIKDTDLTDFDPKKLEKYTSENILKLYRFCSDTP